MQDIELTNKLEKALNLDAMSETERNAILERTGTIILDSSITRLLVSLSEAEVAQIQLYLDSHDNDDADIVGHLLKTYPNFEEIVEEEILAFQTEAAAIIA